MKYDLVNSALLMAIWQSKSPKGLIWHTDRGVNIVLIAIQNLQYNMVLYRV